MRAEGGSDRAGMAARCVVTLLAALYFVSFLDRVNAGFGALRMNADPGLTPTSYGIGAGILFVFYVAFAVPANFLLRRFGAARWSAGIATVWGGVSFCMAFIRTPMQFYDVRFCLGAAESGFLPGVISYLTTRFPRAVQGRIVANSLVAVPLSSVLGPPLRGVLFENHLLGLRGWQLMCVVGALPAIVLGCMALRCLPDSAGNGPAPDGEEGVLPRIADSADADLGARDTQGLLSPSVWGLGLRVFPDRGRS